MSSILFRSYLVILFCCVVAEQSETISHLFFVLFQGLDSCTALEELSLAGNCISRLEGIKACRIVFVKDNSSKN